MPRFEPFRALRYAAADLDPLIAPPYDVLSDRDVGELARRDAHNIVHVDVPRESDGPDRYDRAGNRFRAWIDAGVLVADPTPSFTLYRMRFTDASGAERDVVGVLGALEVVDEGAGGVLPHERTTPKASTDRLDLTRSTEANLSPVWGLSLATGLTQLLADPGEPVGAVTVDSVEHVVERVTDRARIDAIRTSLAADDVLIADGHHRYGVSRIYRDEVRHATGRRDSPAESTLAFVGELIEEQLSVEAIHRLYSGIDVAELRAVLERSFELSPADPPTAETFVEMQAAAKLCLVESDGSATWMEARPSAFEGVRSLDGAWLEHALDGVDLEVSYQHGLDEVMDAVTSGRATAAVLTRPVSVTEIERTAREGTLMPPKSTFFAPKLRTGLVVRDLRA